MYAYEKQAWENKPKDKKTQARIDFRMNRATWL